MLQGYAYHRAIRGYTLVYTALCKMIFQEISLEAHEVNKLNTFNSDTFSETTPVQDDLIENLQLSAKN